MATCCFQCVTSFFGMKKYRNLNYFLDNDSVKLKFGRGIFLGFEFKFIKISGMKSFCRQNDETSKYPGKVYDITLTLFLSQNT